MGGGYSLKKLLNKCKMFEYLSLLYGIDIFIKKSRIKRTTTSVNDVANDNIVTFLSLTMPSLKYKKPKSF